MVSSLTSLSISLTSTSYSYSKFSVASGISIVSKIGSSLIDEIFNNISDTVSLMPSETITDKLS